MSFAATVTSYLSNHRLNPGDWVILLDFVRNEQHDLGHAACILLVSADAENGPSASEAEDEEEAAEWAEETRANLALALLARDAFLTTADLDLIICAVEEKEHTEGRHYPSLIAALHALSKRCPPPRGRSL